MSGGRSNVRLLDREDPETLFLPVFEAGGQVPLRVTGISMEPFLSGERDTVWLSPCPIRLRRGDIVFFRRANGQWVLHRLVRVTKDVLLTRGDAQLHTEPIVSGQILAMAVAVEHGGKRQTKRSWRWRFYATVWQWLIPLRPRLLMWLRRRNKPGSA